MKAFKFLALVVCLFSGLILWAQEKSRYFWSTAKNADKIAVIESSQFGKDIKVVGFVDGGEFDGKIDLPSWAIWQVRKEGKYLFPVAMKDGKYIITGERYSIPRIDSADVAKFKDLLATYKAVNGDKEKEFLKKVLEEKTCPGLEFVSIRRLSRLGEFSSVMSKDQAEFWCKIYDDINTRVGTKRFLMYELSRNNFLNCIKIYQSALKDPLLSAMAGRIYCSKDKKAFEKLMIDWLADEKLRGFALMNSQVMIKNPNYIKAVMKLFNPQDKKNLKYFIPVLCTTNNEKAQAFIKNYLATAKDKRDFVNYLTLLSNLYKSNTTPYVKELKIFMRNHRNDRFIQNGAAYPMILASLCKAKDKEGYKLTLEYIAKLKPESKQPLDKSKINNFMCVFHAYNPKLNNLEKLKEGISKELAAK